MRLAVGRHALRGMMPCVCILIISYMVLTKIHKTSLPAKAGRHNAFEVHWTKMCELKKLTTAQQFSANNGEVVWLQEPCPRCAVKSLGDSTTTKYPSKHDAVSMGLEGYSWKSSFLPNVFDAVTSYNYQHRREQRLALPRHTLLRHKNGKSRKKRLD